MQKSLYWIKKKIRFEFGIEVADSLKHVLVLDLEESNKLWEEVLKTALDQINEYKTFRVMSDDEPTPEGYKRIHYHFVFDVKMDGCRKA